MRDPDRWQDWTFIKTTCPSRAPFSLIPFAEEMRLDAMAEGDLMN
jgi:hypothetical protein